jgi:hypothetical protein
LLRLPSSGFGWLLSSNKILPMLGTLGQVANLRQIANRPGRVTTLGRVMLQKHSRRRQTPNCLGALQVKDARKVLTDPLRSRKP